MKVKSNDGKEYATYYFLSMNYDDKWHVADKKDGHSLCGRRGFFNHAFEGAQEVKVWSEPQQDDCKVCFNRLKKMLGVCS